MTSTTLSGREFNQRPSRATSAAANGPVFITHRGRPAYVLLSIEDYDRLARRPESIVDLLSSDDAADGAFDPPRLLDDLGRPVDLS